MKTLALALAALSLAAAPVLAADPVQGLWKTRPDDNGNVGYIRIAPCGAKLCGVLVKSFQPDGKPLKSDNIGKKIVWDMVPEGQGQYDKGKVWSPDRDKTYDSRMTLKSDGLHVKGCILGGWICRDGGVWTRVK